MREDKGGRKPQGIYYEIRIQTLWERNGLATNDNHGDTAK